jgi:accessory gene regulator protein AgrB
MQIPLDFWNVSLWLAVTAIILLITTQLAAAYDGPATLLIEKKRLKNAALLMGMLFLITVAMRICGIITEA